jgi:hypothetical protein
MDDGYRRRDCKGIYLCTSAYSPEEQKLLQKALLDNYSLESKVHYAAGNQRIYIPSKFVDQFNKAVSKYILPCFSYKLRN